MLKKVLVVEDEPRILNFIKLTLEMEDYVVEALNHARETYEKVEAFKPDLIVMDILLSGEDGRKICRNLKKKDTTKDIPIIMMSAYPDAKPSVTEAGADAFISKPFDIQDFVTIVESLIGGNPSANYVHV